MRFCISTTSLGGSMAERLRAAARAGFSGVEFFWQDCIDSGLSFTDIGIMARSHGLAPVSLQPLRGSETREGPRAAAMDEAERFMDAAADLGVKMIGLCANEQPSACGPREAAATLRVIAALAGRRNLKVGFEALSWSTVICDTPAAWEAVETADVPNLGIILDSFHVCARSNDLKQIADIPVDRIFLLQLASADVAEGASLQRVSRHHRTFPDEGSLDVAGLLRVLLERGYGGHVSLELFNDEFRAADPDAIARRGRDSLARLMERCAPGHAMPGGAGA